MARDGRGPLRARRRPGRLRDPAPGALPAHELLRRRTRSGTPATPTCRSPTGTAGSRPGSRASSRVARSPPSPVSPRSPGSRSRPSPRSCPTGARRPAPPGSSPSGPSCSPAPCSSSSGSWPRAPRRPWSAAHVALSPVVALAGFVSADLLGVVLAGAGVWAWSRRRHTLAGVLLGLAIGAAVLPRARPARDRAALRRARVACGTSPARRHTRCSSSGPCCRGCGCSTRRPRPPPTRGGRTPGPATGRRGCCPSSRATRSSRCRRRCSRSSAGSSPSRWRPVSR